MTGYGRQDPAQNATGLAVRVFPPISDERALLDDMGPQLETRVFKPARRIGENLQIVGVSAFPERSCVARTAAGTWFFGVEYSSDPGLQQDGVIAVPADELVRLRSLGAAGLSVDLVWIAHELPATWDPNQPLPQIVPDAQRYGELDVSLERGVKALINTSLKAAKLAAHSLATAAKAVASPLQGLDPVILGGVRHSHEPVVAWAVLAKWNWQSTR